MDSVRTVGAKDEAHKLTGTVCSAGLFVHDFDCWL